MKTIKIGFSKGIANRGGVITLLEKKFDVRVLEKDYDYFFCMENMYWQGSQDLFYEVLNLKPEVIRIFWCGEAVYPDLNLFDYAVCFDNFCGDRTMSRTYYFLEEIADIDSIKNNINFKKC